MTTYQELYQHILDLETDLDFQTTELNCLYGFLSWMNLWDEFIYFRNHAHSEQNEDEPFPRLVL